ncbi:MAG: hypothetical protein H6726_30795 [Sandaracinaceae bacterium]|nr:hypothetical protein [Sandaracinaceae bacterium]
MQCTVTCGDADGDGHDAVACGGDDCDDTDPNRFPGNVEVCDEFDVDEDCNPVTFGTRDEDGDGFVDAACCNVTATGMRLCGQDCADQRRDARPGNTEACDGIDNDCDETVDEGVAVMAWADADHDLHGDEGGSPQAVCADAPGFSVVQDDCDDGAARVHSAQLEICDGVDNDCDGRTDESSAPIAWYLDADIDGFGDPDSTPVISCAVVPGYAVRPGDCDDNDQSMSPSAPERCDGMDNNCDGLANFLIRPGDTEDDDQDGFPDHRCGGNDCNDANPSVYPGAPELCDGIDNDCDGVVDGASADAIWYVDLDGDGFGDSNGPTVMSCTPVPMRVTRGGDCNDASASIRPGANDDCDGIDTDCDGRIDESGLRNAYYQDTDNDGVGDARLGIVFACPNRVPVGAVEGGGDCNDDNPTIFANAPELCDGLDNDCDGMMDEDAPQSWYPDGDSDGHGSPVGGMVTCNPPQGYVLSNDDCDDLDAGNFPGNVESCDGFNNDCDMQVDEDGAAACMLANGTGVCMNGACQVASCVSGRDSCDGTFSTGCEVSTDRDPAHCGGCLQPCGLGDSCGVGTLGTCDEAPFTQLAATWEGVFALRSTGGSAAWGRGLSGDLGNGAAITLFEPGEGPRGFVELDGGNTFGCARNAAGRVFCFGNGGSGRLGQGTSDTSQRPTPVQAVGITNATGVSAGHDHACAVLATGQVLCWGGNTRGQLGQGTLGGTLSTPTATAVDDALQVYAGLRFTCALRPNPSGGNRVTCFGENDNGELGRGFASTAETDADVDVIGLPSDVVAFGRGAGGALTCARTSGGAVYCWGFSSLQAVGQGSDSSVANRILSTSGAIADAVQLVTGVDTACALRPGAGPGQYSPWCWGDDRAAAQGVNTVDSATARQVLDTTMMPILDATHIAAGQGWACVSRADQSVWCWGADIQGVQGNGTGTAAVQLLAQRVPNVGP